MKQVCNIILRNFITQQYFVPMTCNFFVDDSKQKNCQKIQKKECYDSPLQIKLIKFLGIKDYLIQKFVFRRKPIRYHIQIYEGKECLFYPQLYRPPQGYTLNIKIIQDQASSVPILLLTPDKILNTQTIIYCHGNASDLVDALHFVQKLSKSLTAQFVIFDYSGYGASRVETVDEKRICKDLQLIISWLNKPLRNIVLWGFSLGTYPVIYNAAKYPFKAIILQSPIASISCIFQKQLQTNIHFQEDYLENLKYISQIKSKIFMMHSTADEIIPFSHSKLLYDKFLQKNNSDRITLIEVSKIKHNAMSAYLCTEKSNSLKDQLLEFLQTNFMDHKPLIGEEKAFKQLQIIKKNIMEAELGLLINNIERLVSITEAKFQSIQRMSMLQS